MRKILAMSMLFYLSLFLAACGETMSYQTSAIDIVNVDSSKSNVTEIIYQPLLESMYYCPGVTLKVSGTRVKVAFVRCEIGQECKVDVKAEDLKGGHWKVSVVHPINEIDLKFSDGEKRLQ